MAQKETERKEEKVILDGSSDFYLCPNCRKRLSRTYKRRSIRYCERCGQKLDWEDGNGEKSVEEIEAFLREKEPFMFEWHDGGDDIY